MKLWVWIVLGLVVGASLAAEFTLLAGKDAHWWNHVPGFYIYWGFLSCIVIIYVSKWIGKLLLFRDEDYYDR